jgi:hypothetical protein
LVWEKGGQDDEEERERRVVQREDSQHAAGIELTEVACVSPGVAENTCDQKTGKHKEEVDTNPTRSRETNKQFVDEYGRLRESVTELPKVQEQNQQNRDAA